MLAELIQIIFDDVKVMFALFFGVLILGSLFSIFGDPYGIGESIRTAIMLFIAIPSGIGIFAYIIANTR